MGDRANVAIVDANADHVIVFYTHWGGSKLPNDVHDAIQLAKPRWNDSAYFNRIVLHNLMNAATTPDSDIGAGVSIDTSAMGEYPVIVVDPMNHFVGCLSEKQFHSTDWSADWFYQEDQKVETIDFSDLTARSLSNLRDGVK